jgi:hypothetical protein
MREIWTEQWCFQARVKSGFGVVRLGEILVLTAQGRERDAKSERQEEVNHGIHRRRVRDEDWIG